MFSLTAVSYLSCTAITYHMEQRYSINVTVFQMISNRIIAHLYHDRKA